MKSKQVKESKDSNNLELITVKPGMSFKEVEKNLVAALRKSGVPIDGYNYPDQE